MVSPSRRQPASTTDRLLVAVRYRRLEHPSARAPTPNVTFRRVHASGDPNVANLRAAPLAAALGRNTSLTSPDLVCR
jgi:hypothetical protein